MKVVSLVLLATIFFGVNSISTAVVAQEKGRSAESKGKAETKGKSSTKGRDQDNAGAVEKERSDKDKKDKAEKEKKEKAEKSKTEMPKSQEKAKKKDS